MQLFVKSDFLLHTRFVVKLCLISFLKSNISSLCIGHLDLRLLLSLFLLVILDHCLMLVLHFLLGLKCNCIESWFKALRWPLFSRLHHHVLKAFLSHAFEFLIRRLNKPFRYILSNWFLCYLPVRLCKHVFWLNIRDETAVTFIFRN